MKSKHNYKIKQICDWFIVRVDAENFISKEIYKPGSLIFLDIIKLHNLIYFSNLYVQHFFDYKIFESFYRTRDYNIKINNFPYKEIDNLQDIDKDKINNFYLVEKNDKLNEILETIFQKYGYLPNWYINNILFLSSKIEFSINLLENYKNTKELIYICADTQNRNKVKLWLCGKL